MPSLVEVTDENGTSIVEAETDVQIVEALQAITQVEASQAITQVEALSIAPAIVEAQSFDVQVVEVFDGPKGDKGDPGSSTGVQNLYVQETDPALDVPGLWFELNPDGSPKTLWVENGL